MASEKVLQTHLGSICSNSQQNSRKHEIYKTNGGRLEHNNKGIETKIKRELMRSGRQK